MHTPLHARRRGPLGWALLLLSALLLTGRPGQAQVDTYTFAATTGTYTNLPATATAVPVILADDAISATLPIGFTFVYDGTPYTSFVASSNGFLSFNTAAGSNFSNNLTSGGGTERPLVAPLWDDLGGGDPTSVASYLLTGTAPNRVLTFEWRNWRWRYVATAPVISFQVKLYEGTNRVEFVYRPETAAPSGPTASIGLAGVGTGAGSFLSVSDLVVAPTVSSTVEAAAIATAPVAGLTFAFTPPVPSLCPTPRNLTATTLTATTATVTYTVTNTTPGPFTILYGPTGFNPALPNTGTNTYATATATGTTTTLVGLTPQTGYQFYVTQNCGGTNGSSSLSNAGAFTTNPNPAVNDECPQAIGLTVTPSCATPVTGTVFGATQSLAPSANCGGTVARDVWYSFVASATALQLTTGAQFTGYYDVLSGTCAATTSVSCGLLGSTTATSQVVISGLTMGQTYFLRVYATATTAPVATASGFTLCLTPVLNYCNTGLGGACGSNDITAVTIAGTTLNATLLTCTTVNGQAYTAYPATGANTATLQSGVPYQLSVTVGAGSIASLWIDYNHNLAFEASEFTQIATSSIGTAPTVVTINLPTNAVQGPTGLRIRTRSAGSPNGATDACTQFFSGETKDFTITIGPPAACPTASNVSVGSITSTSASLVYTASASATNYTLTLTPQNGTATTRTVAASPVSLTPLAPNTTYTVSLVSNCSGTTTSPAVVLTFTTLPTPATNDECATAIGLTVNTTCTTPTNGTVLGASQSLPPTTACFSTAALDVWYSFVASSNSQTITFAPQFAGIYDVRSGTCATSTSLFCASVGAAATNSSTIGGLTPGQTYFLRVYASGTQPTGTATTFTLCVVTGPATPVNDDCAGAINVPIQFGTCITQTSANNTAATNSTGVSAPTCASYLGKDIWFKVTVPVSGTVSIKTLAATGGGVTDTGLSVYSGTCGALTDIGCNDDFGGTLYSQLDFTGRTPGEVLYIRTWAYNNNTSGLIAVCVTSPSNCAVPTAPAAGTLTNTTAVLSWSATPAAGNTFEIEYGAPNFTQGTGTMLVGITGLSTTLTGLMPSTAYCFYVRQNCGAANGSSAYAGPICFTTPLTIPNNDEPCGAIALGSTGTVNGTNLGATTSLQNGISLPACGPTQVPKDVWYTVTPSGTSTTLTLTGNAASMVRVFTAPDCANGPFTQVFCQNAPTPNTALGTVVIPGLTARTRYYLAISGAFGADASGNFTVAGTNLLATKGQVNTTALVVYPNPSNTGQLSLSLTGVKGAGQATLLNALGQVVLTKGLTSAIEQTLTTRGLATGVYTLRVTVADQTFTRKVVLE